MIPNTGLLITMKLMLWATKPNFNFLAHSSFGPKAHTSYLLPFFFLFSIYLFFSLHFFSSVFVAVDAEFLLFLFFTHPFADMAGILLIN